MVKYMEKLVMGSTPAAELNVEERNLLFVSHRVVVARSVAYRVVNWAEGGAASLPPESRSCRSHVQQGQVPPPREKKIQRQTHAKNARREEEEEERIFKRERERERERKKVKEKYNKI